MSHSEIDDCDKSHASETVNPRFELKSDFHGVKSESHFSELSFDDNLDP